MIINLAPNWRINSDTTWVLEDGGDGNWRPVGGFVSRSELYLRLQKLGVPLTDDARDQLSRLPEFHEKYAPLGKAQQQVVERVWSDRKLEQ